MKSSRKQNFRKPVAGPCGARAKIHNVTCSANPPVQWQEPQDLLRPRKAHRYPGHCRASNGHQYPTYHKKYLESSQVKSQGLPNCSLTSSTRAASPSIFSSSSFLWEMSFIRDVDVSMASCSFL